MTLIFFAQLLKPLCQIYRTDETFTLFANEYFPLDDELLIVYSLSLKRNDSVLYSMYCLSTRSEKRIDNIHRLTGEQESLLWK